MSDLHYDLRLLRSAGPPEHEREEGEERDEAEHEDEEVVALLGHDPGALLVVQEPLLLDDPDLLPSLALRRALAGRRRLVPLGSLGVAREAAGGGVPSDGGVGVARRGHGAERGRGVHGGGRLVAVVGVPGGALDVVDGARARRGARRRGGRQAGHLRVRLGVRHLDLDLDLQRRRKAEPQRQRPITINKSSECWLRASVDRNCCC